MYLSLNTDQVHLVVQRECTPNVQVITLPHVCYCFVIKNITVLHTPQFLL